MKRYIILVIVALLAGIVCKITFEKIRKRERDSINNQWIEELDRRGLIIRTTHSFNWKERTIIRID